MTDPKYGFLKQLGITIENPGLYDGRWGGSGKVRRRRSPSLIDVVITSFGTLLWRLETVLIYKSHYVQRDSDR